MTWQPDHRGILTLWFNNDAIAAVSPISRDGSTEWYWYTYVNDRNGFCDTIDGAQAEAERAVDGSDLH
jgi:hypothetical protein